MSVGPAGGDDWPQQRGSDDWPQQRGSDDWPQQRGSDDWPQQRGSDDWPQQRGSDDWPQQRGGDDWPQQRGGDDWPQQRGAASPVPVLVIEHDPADPLLRLEAWLRAAGAVPTICRPHLGDPVPVSTAGYLALISLGGEMGAWDDEIAPWLPDVRQLLARAVRSRTPTLGICLGAQLLAAATSGVLAPGRDGPEIGAYLVGKRDAADRDPLFAALPMTPDVMQFHHDVVSQLPPDAVLLLSSTDNPHQAWRIGQGAWGVQFHIETSAADLRAWATADAVPISGRLGSRLDDAETSMTEVWSGFIRRFVDLARVHRGVMPPARERLRLAGHG